MPPDGSALPLDLLEVKRTVWHVIYLTRIVAAACMLLGLVLAAPASAAGPGSSVVPADGAVLAATPREIVIDTTEDPTGPVLVVLTDADTLREIPFTDVAGSLTTGREIRVFPPALEPGTYMVQWSYEGGSGPRVGVSHFSIGAPSAAVVTLGEGPAGSSSGTATVLLILLSAWWLAVAVRSWTRRRVSPAYLLAALVGITAAALSTSLPLWWRTAVVVLSVGAGLSWWVRPRYVLPVSGVATAALAGYAATSTGALPYVAGALGALGAAALAVLLGSVLALGLAPGRARVVMRRWWSAPVLSALVLPSLWAGLWILRQADLQDRFAAAASIGLAVLLSMVAFVVGAAAALLLVRRSARAATVVAFVSFGLLGSSVWVLVPPSGSSVATQVLAVNVTGSAVDCLSEGDRLSTTVCLQGMFSAKAQNVGVVPSLDELRTAMQATPALRFFCHETAHAIGRSSLVVHEEQIAAAFADGYDVCDFGYYHGIIEAAAGSLTDDEFTAAVPNLCAELASVDRLFFLQCTHGLGHAAARRANNDMVRALEFCDAIEGSPAYPAELLDGALNACGTGVTMEWFAVAGAVGRADGEAVSPAVESLRDVCLAVPDKWAPECLEYVGNTLDTGRPRDSLFEMAQWCLTTAFPASCFNGLARAAGGVGLPHQDAVEMCSIAGPDRRECLRDYLLTVATTIDYDVAAVDRICVLLPDEDRKGPDAVCTESRRLAEEILAASDGKIDPSEPGLLLQ